MRSFLLRILLALVLFAALVSSGHRSKRRRRIKDQIRKVEQHLTVKPPQDQQLKKYGYV
ncbi:hypothetical protein ANCCAN_04112 [Ancylostoma caninum]|uniref:Uncharacterized protein n=1 Tax=Ancylostoma caninum TaxID=29170 RepID=A0A368GZU0_ANCCA|nr:hypothetical protein ANCCAN_04112 [Ancylostoma caninum]